MAVQGIRKAFLWRPGKSGSKGSRVALRNCMQFDVAGVMWEPGWWCRKQRVRQGLAGAGWGLALEPSLFSSILMQKVRSLLSFALLLQGLLLAAHKAMMDAKNNISQLSPPCYIFPTCA